MATKTIKVIGWMVVTMMMMVTIGLQLCNNNNDNDVNVPKEVMLMTMTEQPAPPPTITTTTYNDSVGVRGELLLLHRQKRYLLFPEGSSFQMVFDLIIPIVDYTNYAIMGITCAVAWELPSKPPSELIENVRTRLSDGTLGVVRRNGSSSTTTTINAPGKAPVAALGATPPVNWYSLHETPNQPPWLPPLLSATAYGSGTSSTFSSGYANANRNVNRNGNGNGQQQAANWHSMNANNNNEYYSNNNYYKNNNWWERNKARVTQNWREKQRLWSSYREPTLVSPTPSPTPRNSPPYATSGYRRNLLQAPPRHRIYPVFARRRRRRRQIDATDDAFEQLHLRQHLSSREQLFRKIERLYNMRKLNGTACVLRALCESYERHRLGQQQQQQHRVAQPQSFIMELLSAIFQLPTTGSDADEAANHISPHYLAAHRSQVGECHQLYSDCSHGFWFDTTTTSDIKI